MDTHPSQQPTTPDSAVDSLLRRAGLRVTAPRRAVVEVLREHPHSDASAVIALTRARAGWVSVQGVYDVLHVLTRARVLRQVQPAVMSPARYELDRHDNHHHLACRVCGELRDVPCPVGAAPCLDPAQTHGFVVDEAEIVFWGTCPACRDEPATVPRPPHDHPHREDHR